MYLVQIFLPVFDNDGQPIPQGRFERTAQDLTRRFGGLTAYTRAPAKGVWKHRGERSARDDLVIYEVMCARLQRRWWKAKRLELQKAFRQEKILIRGHAVTQL